MSKILKERTTEKIIPKKKITVAIVTARRNQDTFYSKWQEVRNNFLNRVLVSESKHLTGEFGALLASCFSSPVNHHVEYQLRALSMGTLLPDRFIIVDRLTYQKTIQKLDFFKKTIGIATQPMISKKELELNPEIALSINKERSNEISFGCSDKNTAIVLCETDYLLMLDDCCLPGFGLVQAAVEACDRGNVLLIGHKQLYLEEKGINAATANWPIKREEFDYKQAKDLRRVFGIWAMPLKYMLDMNGFNTDLDTSRNGLDEELLIRMDRYVRENNLKYEMNPAAKVYEIGHVLPWIEQKNEWKKYLDKDGYRTYGPDLKQIRKNLKIDEHSDIFELEEI